MGAEHVKPYHFQPGNKLGGKPKGYLTKPQVNTTVGKLLKMSIKELEEVLNSKATPMLELCIASVILRSFKEGDAHRLEAMLSRSVGRIGETIMQHMTDEENENDKEINSLPREAVLKIVEEFKAKKEA
jgi:hypothetical protein